MPRMMCVTAHPDDEAGNFGGCLQLYAGCGVETCVICLTPGQAATHRGNAKNDMELAALRRQEFAAACAILKVTNGVVLDYPDGQLHRMEAYKVVCELVLKMREFRPQVVLTFGPEGGVTGHTDHSMASIFDACFSLGRAKQPLSRPVQRPHPPSSVAQALPRDLELHSARPAAGHTVCGNCRR